MKYKVSAQRLIAARESAGLTQAEASRETGIKQGTLSSYETGRAIPGLKNMYKLSRAYGKQIDELTEQIIVDVADDKEVKK